MHELLTLGHSSHPLPRLLELLAQHGVDTVADVRSHPTSRHHPQYRKAPLARALREAGVAYVFLGDALGARPDDPALRDAQGRADFARIAASAPFRAGLERVRREAARTRLALLCAERDPADCHRTLLVARHLRHDPTLRLVHVRGDGRRELHAETERRLVARAGLAQGSLFETEGGSPAADPVERAYDRLARHITSSR